MLSDDYSRDIIFHRVLVDGKPFVLPLNRDQLHGLDIKFFGADPNILEVDINTKLFNSKVIKTRVKTLASIIKDNGGRVRIYTTIGIDNDKFGIQYIKPDLSGEKFKYLDRPSTYTELEPHYFKIDFSKGELRALRTLEKIVGLSMSFCTQPRFRDFRFIMNGIDGNGRFYGWEHKEMICAFGRKFFTKEELFSPNKYTTTKTNYGFEQVVIENNEGVFNLEKANNLWTLFSFYIPFNVDLGKFNDIFSDINSFYI